MLVTDQYKIAILLGILPRSGTNYLAKLMSYHPEVRLIPPNTTSGEIGVMSGFQHWKSAVKTFDEHFVSPGVPKQTVRFEDFAKYIGAGWIDYLVKRFEVPPGCLFLKEPTILGLQKFYDIFPNAKLLVLVRDGRDQAASFMRASLAKRRTTTRTNLMKSYINHLIWRDFILDVINWRDAATAILKFEKAQKDQQGKTFLILHYEDVYNNPKEKMAEVFDFLELDYDDSLLSELAEAEVVGSSFLSSDQKENARKPNWTPTPKSRNFSPVGRWKEWSAARKTVFKKIAGQRLIDFGYEKDFNW